MGERGHGTATLESAARDGRADEAGQRSPTGQGIFSARQVPLAIVVLAVLFNLWVLRAEATPVQNLNDASIHASMVRWAESRIRDGHVPLDGWYPYLSLGSSRFHHYQSLPHILTAYASVAFGPSTFQWSLYLLLALWPFSVYWGARLLDLDPWPAAVAAAISPLLTSAPGLGYEFGSYVWRGSGTWSQLWGMWMLPLAWGLSWRAVARNRSLALGALAVALTIALHLLTGYLALLSIGMWVLAAPSEFRRRLVRAALVGVGALLAASWMLVPLLVDAKWTIEDEFSRNTHFYDSFGARRILAWLFSGQIFDADRLPVVTVLAGFGLVIAIARWRRDEPSRAILLAGGLSLLLFFGRPTLGPLIDLLPGGSNLFLRRYIMGVHLAGIYLAGVGGWWLVGFLRRRLASWRPSLRPAAVAAAAGMIVLLVLAPAIAERRAYAAKDGTWVQEQRLADATDGAAFASLVARAKALGGGRVFAGARSGGGPDYRIGTVPAYASLLNHDVDAVGFTRPTWSLASGVEVRFDPANPAHYDLFNVRYVILPEGQEPGVAAEEVARAGRHVLWSVPATSDYLRVVDTITPILVDRTNLGQQMSSFIDSGLPAEGLFPTVGFSGEPPAAPSLPPDAAPDQPPGVVVEEFDGPADGFFAGTVRAERPAVVLLKASYDPRWRASVDGVEAPTQMVAPASVGVTVGPGQHRIVFTYEPYPWYPVWLAAGALSLMGLLWAQDLLGRRETQ